MEKIKVEAKAPKKLSQAIRIAVADLKKVRRRNNFNTDMQQWFATYKNTSVCTVCLAGAVMAGTCKISAKDIRDDVNGLADEYGSGVKAFIPDIFEDSWKNVFFAINAVREGDINEAITHMNVVSNKPYSKVCSVIEECKNLILNHIEDEYDYAGDKIYLKVADLLESVDV